MRDAQKQEPRREVYANDRARDSGYFSEDGDALVDSARTNRANSSFSSNASSQHVRFQEGQDDVRYQRERQVYEQRYAEGEGYRAHWYDKGHPHGMRVDAKRRY